MKIIEHLKRNAPIISFEIIPPERGNGVNDLLETIDQLAVYEPPFIDVTSHAAEMVYVKNGDGNFHKRQRKRPGTLGICALIQNKYGIDAVPHVLCQGFTREETEDFMIELNYLGIHNVLALRGDKSKAHKEVAQGRAINTSAIELVQQITNMNKGKFLDDVVASATDFTVGVAGYPEKHQDATDIAADIAYLKRKVDSGARYIVTQMFFDNTKYFDFVRTCRDAGIHIPIIPGIKVLSTEEQLMSLPHRFGVQIPDMLYVQVKGESSKKIRDKGAAWAARQAEGLLANGAPSVHFYVMLNPKPIHRVMEYLGNKVAKDYL